MRRYCACFHSTSSTWWPNESIFIQRLFFCANIFYFTQHHSTPLDSLNKLAIQLDFSFDFCRVKNRVKNLVFWPGPKPLICEFYFRGVFSSVELAASLLNRYLVLVQKLTQMHKLLVIHYVTLESTSFFEYFILLF